MRQDVVTSHEPAETTPARSRRRVRPVHEIRERRRRLVAWALVFGSFVLLINGLFGDHGYLAAVRMRQEYGTLAEQVGRLRSDNQKMLQDIESLKHDPEALEEAARRQLGLVRPGETLIIIHNAPPTSPMAPSK